jgi:hypothetical protein
LLLSSVSLAVQLDFLNCTCDSFVPSPPPEKAGRLQESLTSGFAIANILTWATKLWQAWEAQLSEPSDGPAGWQFAAAPFHEKAVKDFEDSSSSMFNFFLRQRDQASIRTRFVGPCLDPLFVAKVERCHLSVEVSYELLSLYRNRSESCVLSWGTRVPPERLPRRAVRGWGCIAASDRFKPWCGRIHKVHGISRA